MLTDLLRVLTRKKTQVCFQDMHRVEPISPVFGTDRGLPIDRYYIEHFLADHADRITGRVLEVGANTYTVRFGGNQVTASDVLHVSFEAGQNCLVADLTDCETLPVGQYDCFICTQVFNFIFDIQAAVNGAYQLLKPGGVLLATVAGISQVSRYDMDRWGDYWRFTTDSIDKLFSPIFTDGFHVESYGNALAACALLQGCAVEDLQEQSLLDEVDPDYQVLLTIVAQRGLK